MAMSDFWNDKQTNQPQDARTAWEKQIQEAKRDPTPMFKAMGWNVPPEIQNNPMAILQHLQATGQIQRAQVNNLIRQMSVRR